ncbi:DUF4345 domain-containing protein [Vogesella oryzae]|uniref:DUF4345 domain-containing protein n=1 Tax=Vogesella oryzae TaxID=1735285 RepID=UPI001583180F|nr:DUF4345 domain-containing protein [Vogesella oryzae]
MQSLARIFFWGYALMLVGIGASGMLVAGWELPTVFAVDLPAMGEPQRATLLNQYRFLKALELAFGLFCLAYRRDIFGQPRALCVFLAGLSAGVAARAGSWLADGMPRPIYLVFMALELATGVLVWLAARRRSPA